MVFSWSSVFLILFCIVFEKADISNTTSRPDLIDFIFASSSEFNVPMIFLSNGSND